MVRIKELRKSMKMLQGDLAKKINVSQATVSGWENGSFEPSGEALYRLATLFGVSIDYLLGYSNDKGIAPVKNNEKEPTQEEWDSLTDTQKLIIELMGKLPPEQQDELVRQARYQLWLLLQKDAEQ